MPLPEAYRGAEYRGLPRRAVVRRNAPEKRLRSFLFVPDYATHFAPHPPDEFRVKATVPSTLNRTKRPQRSSGQSPRAAHDRLELGRLFGVFAQKNNRIDNLRYQRIAFLT